MLAVIASPRGSAIIHPDEATLFRELRTVGLLRPHVSVGYRRQNTGLRHLLTACNKYRHDFVSQSPQNRAYDLHRTRLKQVARKIRCLRLRTCRLTARQLTLVQSVCLSGPFAGVCI